MVFGAVIEAKTLPTRAGTRASYKTLFGSLSYRVRRRIFVTRESLSNRIGRKCADPDMAKAGDTNGKLRRLDQTDYSKPNPIHPLSLLLRDRLKEVS